MSGSFLLVAGAKAIVPSTPGNPYQSITNRNIFALKPPPEPPKPEDEKAPPPKIKLTGITTILGRKQVLLLVEVPAKPPQPAKEDSYILTEGQRDRELEVLEVDEKAGSVKVMNHGVLQALDFANNGVKLPAASAIPMAAAPVPIPGQAMNIPRPIPPNPGPAMRQIPTRPVRAVSGDNEQQESTYPGAANPYPAVANAYRGGENPASFGLPNVNASDAYSANPNQSVPPPSQVTGMTSEQQAVVIELERERLQRAGDETFKLMPPTEFSGATQ